jgi:hypothetical protein
MVGCHSSRVRLDNSFKPLRIRDIGNVPTPRSRTRPPPRYEVA